MSTGLQNHLRPRVFCLEAQHDALVGLYQQDQARRFPVQGRLAGKRLMRNRAELDGDFRCLAEEAFAGTQIEWHVLPAPVIDEQPQRRKRFRR
jgi:hypothetical protein